MQGEIGSVLQRMRGAQPAAEVLVRGVGALLEDRTPILFGVFVGVVGIEVFAAEAEPSEACWPRGLPSLRLLASLLLSRIGSGAFALAPLLLAALQAKRVAAILARIVRPFEQQRLAAPCAAPPDGARG